jgi:hypothetical protein
MKIFIVFFISFISIQFAFAQDQDEAKIESGDTLITAKKFGIVGYPIAFYSPETNLAGGLGGMMYFRMGESTRIRPSKILLSAWYTLNNQYYIKIAPQIYFPSAGQDLLDMRFIYSKEIGKFYGIGNDAQEIDNPEFTMNSLRLYAEFGMTHIVSEDIQTGIIFDFFPNDLVDKQSNPFLQDDAIPGSSGGTVSGLGLLMVWDKRENIFFPSNHFYHKLRLQFFGSYLSSDFTYTRFVSDLRFYTSPAESHILAFQIYADITDGTIPFFRLPALGGDQRMRGYFTGRYRDRLYLTSQVEYRKIVWWRVGVAAFVGAGDVANKFSQFNTRTIKYSYGFGLRFVFNQDESINLRMDLGFGKNTSGVYFALEEAF